MDRNTVFTKTAKGITQVNQKSASLSKDLMKILKLVDGKSNFAQIMEKAEADKGALEKALNTLIKDGYARIFETRKEEVDPFAGEDDFDFTAPGKMPTATQRVVPSSALDISELSRQQEKADAERKAREHAQTAARDKARVQAETRAKLETEAKAKLEAEQRAMEQARRAKEASERAKAELEAKTREEETRRKAMAEHQAKLTAEQKAKEEAEAARLGELRRKAEAEARALAEARAKAEAEAQALAKARAEAEAAAKRQAQVAGNAEKELKAQLKEEIEARIRKEMEDLLRNEIEEKARGEMQAQIMAEARLAAKAELEDRLREERDALAKAEMQARIQAEKAARERAEQESKLRAEAEARAAAEAEARAKAEAETARLRRLEARAREEAEAAAREKDEAAKRLESERRAKIEAEARAMVEAEERERRERELSAKIDSERKAKEEAEMRARIEAKARETIAEDTRVKVQAELEADMEKRAEIEGKAQAKAYMQAKAKAELDEDARLRSEQDRKAREIAEILRTKVEPDEVAPEAPTKRKYKRRRNWVKTIFYTLAAVLVIGVGLLHVIPLRGFADKIEKGLAGWLHEEVSISSLKFTMIPTPHLKFEALAVGKLLDAKASNGRIFLDIGTLFGEKVAIDTLELDNVTLSNDAVRRILKWAKVEGKKEAAQVGRIRMKGIKMDVKPVLEPFDANLSFGADGAFKEGYLSGGGRWTLAVKPAGAGFDLDFGARNWELPLGAAIPISEVKLRGRLEGSEIVVPEFEADTMEGKVNGTLKVSWAQGVRIDSDLALAKVRAEQLVGAFTRDISVTGKLDGNFSFAAEGPALESLFTATRSQGKFRLAEGSISNVDLVAVMQSPEAGQRAGVTKFAELTGEFGQGEGRSAFRQVNLQGGVLRGAGAIDIAANNALSGRVSLEIRSNVAQDRGAFVVSGTVAKPAIRRGG